MPYSCIPVGGLGEACSQVLQLYLNRLKRYRIDYIATSSNTDIRVSNYVDILLHSLPQAIRHLEASQLGA